MCLRLRRREMNVSHVFTIQLNTDTGARLGPDAGIGIIETKWNRLLPLKIEIGGQAKIDIDRSRALQGQAILGRIGSDQRQSIGSKPTWSVVGEMRRRQIRSGNVPYVRVRRKTSACGESPGRGDQILR